MKYPINLSIFILIFLFSCTPKPQPINYGEDGCHYCKMTIVDSRYAAEAVTSKSKVYKFDAVECLLNFMNENSETEFSLKLISPFDSEGLTSAESCVYLRTPELPSPMGEYLNGLSDRAFAEELQQKHGGEIYTWNELSNKFGSLPDLNTN
ncbi:nitrous oxide reductase accessory protein NosL [Mangrovivirga sp. M17]|uniref:Nitrous oxide reductase accessory protein NosL n=1 Tax=Mangrovivirga halotolerans TaxID=2993936 RepID=A0ABT3RQB0_9BACT|nr:nitrous oxide reductase accessory protein NosL [Mangrovivirga halotolerans]MCX2743559.1 nitrous oxide reductase accessory protein NosL [Mangrovivirga halotolerans]